MRTVLRPLALAGGLFAGCNQGAHEQPSRPPEVALPAPVEKSTPKPADPAKAPAAALSAANDVEGATPCERAFSGFSRMREAAEARAGALPAREQFLAGCNGFPVEVQRCLELRWAVTHGKDCQEAQGRLDPAAQARLQSLVKK